MGYSISKCDNTDVVIYNKRIAINGGYQFLETWHNQTSALEHQNLILHTPAFSSTEITYQWGWCCLYHGQAIDFFSICWSNMSSARIGSNTEIYVSQASHAAAVQSMLQLCVTREGDLKASQASTKCENAFTFSSITRFSAFLVLMLSLAWAMCRVFSMWNPQTPSR